MNPGLGLPASQPAGFQPQSAGAAYQQAAYSSQPAQPGYNAQPSQQAADQRYAAPARPQVQVSEPRTAPPQQRAVAAPQSAFDSFVSQQAPANGYQASPYDTGNTRQNPAYPSLGQGAQNGYGDAGANDQQGFGHWGNAPAADARGFDYGSYGGVAPQPANNGHAQAAYGQQQPHYGQNGGFAAQDEWGHNEGYDQEPSLDASGYGHDQHGYHGEQGALEQSYADDEEYEEEPRPRRKLTLIAAAVAGALMCGGGLAYGYKTFLGPVATASNTPLIKTSSIPSKVKPDDPGGRKFAHSEPSIMGGGPGKVMGEPLSDGAAAGASGAENARKVQTVEVRPDGSVVPSSGGTMSDARPAPMSASASDFPTAGESIGGSNGAPPEPQVMARAEPSPPPAAPPPRQEAMVDEAPSAVTPPKKVQAKKVAAASAPEGSIGAPAPSSSGAGWVAVLASVPVSGSSQMDSLKQFADMQQKYGEVLGDKTPSVQEANLGEKGRYHRLVVGPPGSRDSANSVCGSLKSAGFSGCWVAQY